MLRTLRNTAFLLWMIGVLAVSTLSFGIWAMSKTAQVASLTATMAANTIAHRTALTESAARLRANTIAHRTALTQSAARLRAKARLRRFIVAVPITGLAFAAYFEEHDYQEWLQDNPDGDRTKYACEVAIITAEVLNEVLQELPENLQPNPNSLERYITCED